jgi:murein L,D-transpeptidase YafK
MVLHPDFHGIQGIGGNRLFPNRAMLRRDNAVFQKVLKRKILPAHKLCRLLSNLPWFGKKEALLEVWINSDEVYRHLKDYRICAYSGELGPKEKEGDKQSPEGFYKVKKHHLNPNSKFHLSFNLGYPNDYDKAHKRTGSFLMVHGNCVSIGCYAMTDEKIEEIYALVEAALDQGQKYVQVHIYPFRMTEKNMALYDESEWYDFWVNLKEGYDYFESEHLPPYIKVEKKHYSIKEAKE